MQAVQMLNPAATGAVTGPWLSRPTEKGSFQVTITGTGAIAATVAIEVSDDAVNAQNAMTFTMSGTTSDTAARAMCALWKFARAVVSAPSGSITSITATMETD